MGKFSGRNREKMQKQIRALGMWLIKNADKVVAGVDFNTGIDIYCSIEATNDAAPEIEISSRYVDIHMIRVQLDVEQEDDDE